VHACGVMKCNWGLQLGKHGTKMLTQNVGSDVHALAEELRASKKEPSRTSQSGNVIAVRPRPPRMKDLMRSSFSTAERAVFGALCDYSNAKSDMWPPWVPKSDGFAAWPSIETIAAITNLTDRGVQKALAKLELGNAIYCIYRSKGGAPKKRGGGMLPARTNCYLITPNSVHPSREPDDKHAGVEPRSEARETPNSVPNNPELSSPNNPELSSPEVFNHHHQEERAKERTKEKKAAKWTLQPHEGAWDFESLRSMVSDTHQNGKANPRTAGAPPNLPDDDEHGPWRKGFDDPQQEFRARLEERQWLNGRIVEPEGIVLMVRDVLGNNPSKWKRFLDYEASLTTPQNVKNVGGYYRMMVKEFLAAEDNTRIYQQRATREGKWQCPDGVEGCKNSLIENDSGVPVKVCSCARTLLNKDRDKRYLAVREAAVLAR
jgi:hypothetical protein